MRILAIHAHPDDIEILAGGTVALLSAAGHSLVLASMSAGDCGSAEHTADDIARIRRSEARESAELIGAEYVWCGFSDLKIFNDDPSRRRVTEILRKTRPELVITSAPVDYMADHDATSVLVKDACFGAPVPLYRTEAPDPAPPLPRIPHLYYMDPLTGMDPAGKRVLPDFCVDVSTQMETKRAMLAKHASQRNWLRKHHGMDNYITEMEHSTQAAGAPFGLDWGEGFRHYRGHAYPETPLLEELLGGYVRLRQP